MYWYNSGAYTILVKFAGKTLERMIPGLICAWSLDPFDPDRTIHEAQFRNVDSSTDKKLRPSGRRLVCRALRSKSCHRPSAESLGSTTF